MQYEPTIEELRHKYEVAMKEKMLVRLEKERLQARTEALEAQVLPPPPTSAPSPHPHYVPKRKIDTFHLDMNGTCNHHLIRI